MRKCQGEARETYPGIQLYSEVDTRDGSCNVRTSVPAIHNITAINASLLTYEIIFRSTCDKEYLQYMLPRLGTDAKAWEWEGQFTAPYRWDEAPRASSDMAQLAAKGGKAAATDREIDVVINCKAAAYATVGPFGVLLQVDTEDS